MGWDGMVPRSDPCVLPAMAVSALRAAERVVSFSSRRCKSANTCGNLPCSAGLSPKQLTNYKETVG